MGRLTRSVALLDGIGSVGALVVALAAPCCLPLFAMIADAVGITALGLNEKFVLFALQGFNIPRAYWSRLRRVEDQAIRSAHSGRARCFRFVFLVSREILRAACLSRARRAMRCQRLELSPFTKAQR
jgi:hypothetical protein